MYDVPTIAVYFFRENLKIYLVVILRSSYKRSAQGYSVIVTAKLYLMVPLSWVKYSRKLTHHILYIYLTVWNQLRPSSCDENARASLGNVVRFTYGQAWIRILDPFPNPFEFSTAQSYISTFIYSNGTKEG